MTDYQIVIAAGLVMYLLATAFVYAGNSLLETLVWIIKNPKDSFEDLIWSSQFFYIFIAAPVSSIISGWLSFSFVMIGLFVNFIHNPDGYKFDISTPPARFKLPKE